jgi:hypothetical protein
MGFGMRGLQLNPEPWRDEPFKNYKNHPPACGAEYRPSNDIEWIVNAEVDPRIADEKGQGYHRKEPPRKEEG